MAKTIIKLERKSTADVRKKIRFFYMEKYFNKWMNKFMFVGLNYQQVNFFMKKMWAVGSVAVSQITSADKELAGLVEDGLLDFKENKLIITPWAPAQRFNIYDYPTHVRLVNTRGVKFITDAELALDEEVVIIYALKNHKSILSSIEAKIEEIVDVEMKKRVARKAQSQPWFFALSPEDRELAKVLQESIEADVPYLFAPLNYPDKAKGLTSGAPYIVDKLEQERAGIDDEILTMLGVNNLGVGEKKEHFIVDEVNANNEEIQQQAVSLKSEVADGWDRANKCFGTSVKVIDMNEITSDETQNEESKDEEEFTDEEN